MILASDEMLNHITKVMIISIHTLPVEAFSL
jgi:hypothetical protein